MKFFFDVCIYVSYIHCMSIACVRVPHMDNMQFNNTCTPRCFHSNLSVQFRVVLLLVVNIVALNTPRRVPRKTGYDAGENEKSSTRGRDS